MKKALVFLGVLLVVMSLGAPMAGAATSKDTFVVLVGEEAPNVARAANGDTISVVFEGEFNGATNEAGGEGTFEHRTPDGTLLATGDLTATRLISFQFYGCGVAGGEEIPPNLCGGRATIAIDLVGHPVSNPSVSHTSSGIMEVNCQIGDPPPGTSEGTTIRAKRFGNFNEHVSGENVFILED